MDGWEKAGVGGKEGGMKEDTGRNNKQRALCPGDHQHPR